MSNILVTGSEHGLGKAIVDSLIKDGHTVFGYDKDQALDVRWPNPYFLKVIEELDVLINNAGINGIDFLEDLKEEDWDKIVDTNAKGIYMMTKACLPKLIESKGTVLNIVSNAAHMPMTSSLAYNASKGAALIMTKQLARELTKRYGITVFSISPNKLHGTAMSEQIDDEVVRTRGWTKEQAVQYQLNGILAGEETPVEAVAEFVTFLLSSKERHKYLTGTDIPYGL